ncbi:MAG: exopolysaccharide Pel transporter PelG [Pleomorphochaeta sp.]
MAGIGFALKRMFQKETFTNRALAYLYSSFIAAGPWILSVLSINILLLLLRLSDATIDERNLFSATIVYSFIFSQILVSPIQLVVTRYISDNLYQKKYDRVKSTFIGVNNLTLVLSLIISIVFYYNKPIPIYYKIISSYLFIIISMIWILMIFLSAVKNYKLIAKAYLIGGIITIALIFIFNDYPIPFENLQLSSNYLFAYVIGLSTILVLFLFNLFSTFFHGDVYKFDYISYLGKYKAIGFVGFFYTLGLWSDNIIMWFSTYQIKIYNTFIFAPYYDNAVFIAYLTTIPTLVLFFVIIETEFYITYKNYYGQANSAETYKNIDLSRRVMRRSLSYNLFYTFLFQILITITFILVSKPIFKELGINYLVRNIFQITAIGTMFNIFAFVIILVLLYFERRAKASIVAIIFFVLNSSFSYYFTFHQPIKYAGYGFTIASTLTFFIGLFILISFFKNINYTTFATQPIYIEKDKDIFMKLADKLNKHTHKKYTENKK